MTPSVFHHIKQQDSNGHLWRFGKPSTFADALDEIALYIWGQNSWASVYVARMSMRCYSLIHEEFAGRKMYESLFPSPTAYESLIANIDIKVNDFAPEFDPIVFEISGSQLVANNAQQFRRATYLLEWAD